MNSRQQMALVMPEPIGSTLALRAKDHSEVNPIAGEPPAIAEKRARMIATRKSAFAFHPITGVCR